MLFCYVKEEKKLQEVYLCIFIFINLFLSGKQQVLTNVVHSCIQIKIKGHVQNFEFLVSLS